MRKTITIECSSCGGTGLYQGMAERDGCAMVCHICDGTGKTQFTYNEFEGKKVKTGIKRVFAKSVGYIHSANDVTTSDSNEIKFSEGGCTYEEWLNGVEPKPVKDLYCPYLWDNKGIGNEPLEDCKVHCRGFGSISNCEIFHKKAECWAKLQSME